MHKYCYIYGLVDPRDNEIRYVGKSTSPRRRYQAHFQWSFNNLERAAKEYPGLISEKDLWIYEVRKTGRRPRLTIIELCMECEVKDRERYWINKLSENGRYLANGTMLRATNEQGPLQKKYTEFDGDS